jgi:hypothetical protein
MMEIEKNRETVPKKVESITDDDLFCAELTNFLCECESKNHRSEYYSLNISISSFNRNGRIIFKMFSFKTEETEYSYISPDRKMDGSHLLNLINRGENKYGSNFEKSI